jgi:hypothetical protein
MQLFLKISHLLDTIEFPKTLASNPRGSKLKGHFLNILMKIHPFKYQVFIVICANSILNCISCTMTSQIRLCNIGVLLVFMLSGCQSQKIAHYQNKYGRLTSGARIATNTPAIVTRNDSIFTVKMVVDSDGLVLGSRVYYQNHLYSDTIYYKGKWIMFVGRYQLSKNRAVGLHELSRITYYDKKGNPLWMTTEKSKDGDTYTRVQYYNGRNELLPARYAYPDEFQ